MRARTCAARAVSCSHSACAQSCQHYEENMQALVPAHSRGAPPVHTTNQATDTHTRMPCCMLHSHLACTGVLAHGTKKANRTDPTSALRRSSQAASLASLARTTTAHCVVPRRIRERGAGSSAPCCRAAHQPRTQQLAVASA